ncbi:hypothetical protein C0993_005392 [Termitomyces sp. T159_Od127]|nr:hypothetical protein C0993_005392 [Termitomyces sp. T159_Od127]
MTVKNCYPLSFISELINNLWGACLATFQTIVMTCYQPPGLSPSPKTPTSSNPPPQLFRAQTATQPAILAAPGHHCPSLPPATATTDIPLAITTVTATSALALAITLPVTATSAVALAIPDTSSTTATTSALAPATSGTLPGLCQDPHHASQSHITIDLTFACHTLLLLTSSLSRDYMSLRSQSKTFRTA